MNIQSKTTTIGKATIVVKDKPSLVNNTYMLQVSLILQQILSILLQILLSNFKKNSGYLI